MKRLQFRRWDVTLREASQGIGRYHRPVGGHSLGMPGHKMEDSRGPKNCVVHTCDVGSGVLCVLRSCMFVVWCVALCDMYIPIEQLSKLKSWTGGRWGARVVGSLLGPFPWDLCSVLCSSPRPGPLSSALFLHTAPSQEEVYWEVGFYENGCIQVLV